MCPLDESKRFWSLSSEVRDPSFFGENDTKESYPREAIADIAKEVHVMAS